MKKIFLVAGFLVLISSIGRAQTNSEITNILNTKGISITTVSATANNSNLFSVDLLTTGATYRMIDITITGTWVATVSFQGSNDNFTTIDAIPVYEITSASNAAVTTTAANGTFQINTGGWRYVRVRTTAFTSGTVASVAYGYLNNVNFVNRSVAATIQNSSLAVTNTGTFATQSVLTTGSAQIGHLEANQSVNTAQINGVTPLMGNGTTGTGSQRVTIASDNTAFTVNAAQSGTWNVGTLTSITNNNPSGSVAHDGVGTGVNPLLIGGYASAAAPTDVSADGDATRIWLLRNGSPVV